VGPKASLDVIHEGKYTWLEVPQFVLFTLYCYGNQVGHVIYNGKTILKTSWIGTIWETQVYIGRQD